MKNNYEAEIRINNIILAGEGTVGAWNFAVNSNNQAGEVESNWWQFFSDYRFRRWREELDELTEEQGVSLQDICRYLGVTYRKGIGFYDKLPKKRNMYIGIGMALNQPLETINQWIVRYGMKRKLYVKDLEEDMPWIYLICCNYRDRSTKRNYYSEYEACKQAAHSTYLKCWEDGVSEDLLTQIIETDLQSIEYDAQYEGLCRFVMCNIDSFKTAYVKPRTMLDQCVERLILANAGSDSMDAVVSLNSMRGYLDDSMINYLSGDVDTINVTDLKSGKRTLKFKHVPKSKKAHISLALALGMSREEIDRYLMMMGFARLDAVDIEEGLLLNALVLWEQEHPLPGKLRGSEELSDNERLLAARQMLQLRQDLQEMYQSQGRELPYLKI